MEKLEKLEWQESDGQGYLYPRTASSSGIRSWLLPSDQSRTMTGARCLALPSVKTPWMVLTREVGVDLASIPADSPSKHNTLFHVWRRLEQLKIDDSGIQPEDLQVRLEL
jgi:hypothetical protein